MEEFYDALAPYYRLIYQDWEASVERQSAVLDGVIREYFGKANSILDAACGIGTQCIGLAARGYRLSASDISAGELELARQNAAARGLDISFQVADMRRVAQVYQQKFDVVMACDNAIPHLLSDVEILETFKQFHACTLPEGGCILSIRDYAALELGGKQLHPRTLHDTPEGRTLIVDVWEFDGDYYDLSMYVVVDRGAGEASTQVIRGGRYYCVTIARLEQLLREAGFKRVVILRERFFQPLLVGLKD
jgi:SAM-dependent methyltransferase